MNSFYYHGEPWPGMPLDGLINLFYPVGSYYETTDTTFNPNTAWGGTWELEDEGLVHVSAGTNYAVTNNSKDGGNESVSYTPTGSNAAVTLTAAQSGVGSHSHTPSNTSYAFLAAQAGTVGRKNYTTASGASWQGVYAEGSVSRLNTNSASANATQSHNHTFTGTASNIDVRQPYKIVNRWHRIA